MVFWRLFKAGKSWYPMDTAPRDGTEIEIKCTYGYEPWVQKSRWKQDYFVGPIWEFKSGPNFKTYVKDTAYGSRQNGANNSCMRWRPV